MEIMMASKSLDQQWELPLVLLMERPKGLKLGKQTGTMTVKVKDPDLGAEKEQQWGRMMEKK